MKKSFSILLSLCLLLISIPAFAEVGMKYEKMSESAIDSLLINKVGIPEEYRI